MPDEWEHQLIQTLGRTELNRTFGKPPLQTRSMHACPGRPFELVSLARGIEVQGLKATNHSIARLSVECVPFGAGQWARTRVERLSGNPPPAWIGREKRASGGLGQMPIQDTTFLLLLHCLSTGRRHLGKRGKRGQMAFCEFCDIRPASPS
ncbi:uncharacterized protein L3040_006394 [Drepanopeziza brunnea f. sp. 'multigermtubi']|uniref:uncharacterized protein n=1 Tax=Drepanopeziza brunnea f. sp. 'multigermtubi' TaxID=698441 RepID=UPI0023823A73|nr:hypothetical protein L3040_006394 [Drepanopeziza brunnea f. sp. 'multigermtubi']